MTIKNEEDTLLKWVIKNPYKTISSVVGFILATKGILDIIIDDRFLKGVFFTVLAGVFLIIPFIWQKISGYFNKSQCPLGRNNNIKTLVGRIKSGQSSAIISIFGSERTEILNCLRDESLYGKQIQNITFSYLDLSLLDKECTPTQFWEIILKPLVEKSVLLDIYADCKENNFDNHYLDKLFSQMHKDKLRLVLLLDRFHEILYKTHLKQQSFLGTLRRFGSSLNPSPLCIIGTVNESLAKLYQDIMREAPTDTSPFLNFMEEITLGILPENEINSLLKPYRFPRGAHPFIKINVGRHPYLLRIIAKYLKEAYDIKEQNPLETAKNNFYVRMQEQLAGMLKSWSQKTCLTFVLVAKRSKDLAGFEDELHELKKQGLVYQQKDGQWQVLSPIFSELLEDKDIQSLCSDKSN